MKVRAGWGWGLGGVVAILLGAGVAGAQQKPVLAPVAPAPVPQLRALTLEVSGASTVRINNRYGDYRSLGLYMVGTKVTGTASWSLNVPSHPSSRAGHIGQLEIRLADTADAAILASQLHACATLARQRGAGYVMLGFKSGYTGASFSTIDANTQRTFVHAVVDAAAITTVACE
jgi:hypothetical protein